MGFDPGGGIVNCDAAAVTGAAGKGLAHSEVFAGDS